MPRSIARAASARAVATRVQPRKLRKLKAKHEEILICTASHRRACRAKHCTTCTDSGPSSCGSWKTALGRWTPTRWRTRSGPSSDVLRAAIRVANQAAIALGLAVVQRLLQRIEHEVRAHRTADPPTRCHAAERRCIAEILPWRRMSGSGPRKVRPPRPFGSAGGISV